MTDEERTFARPVFEDEVTTVLPADETVDVVLPGAVEATAVIAPVPPKPAIPAEPKVRRGVRATRKARLRIARIDPWSVMKTSFMFSIAFAVIIFVAIWAIWLMISASGALEAVEQALGALVGNPGSDEGVSVSDYVTQGRVLGLTALMGVLNVVLMTTLSTLISFLYNITAGILGGFEITLAED